MSDLVITSPANQRLKDLVTLRRRRIRESTGATLLEGLEETSLALDAGVRPFTLFHCPELMLDRQVGAALVERARDAGAEIVELGRTAFEKVATARGPTASSPASPRPGWTWPTSTCPTARSSCCARASKSPATSAPCSAPPTPPASRSSSPPTR